MLAKPLVYSRDNPWLYTMYNPSYRLNWNVHLDEFRGVSFYVQDNRKIIPRMCVSGMCFESAGFEGR